jgi:uncharacterized protein (TIGR02265 family)
MGNNGDKLVGRNILEGLLLGVSEQQRPIATKMSVGCGYDPEHPHAFYPMPVIICLAERLARLFCTHCHDEQAYYALGYATVNGYSHTVAGLTFISRQQPMTAHQLISYYLPLINHEIPSVGSEVAPLDACHSLIRISDCPLHPAFLQGCLMKLLQTAGCELPECIYESNRADEYLYRLSWQSAPAEVRGKLFLG